MRGAQAGVWRRRAAVALLSVTASGCSFSVTPSGSPAPDVPAKNATSSSAVETPGTEMNSEKATETKAVEAQTDDKKTAAAVPPAEKKDKPLLQVESTARRAVDRTAGLEVITFDDLNLGMQADMVFRDFLLNDRVRELDGKKIRLIGYMDGGVSQTKGLKEFVLLKNNECKFGPGGQADHLVRVLMKGDATADYSLSALQIEGTLKVSPFNGPDGNTWSVYDVLGESVKVIRSR